MQTPVNQAQKRDRTRIRIQSIEIGLGAPSHYPLNLKILSNGRPLFNLKAIYSGQPLRWEDINPIDIDRSGSVEIRLYELHWFGKKRERIGAVNFPVRDMADAQSSLTGRDASGSLPFSASVKISSTNDSRGAAENTHNQARRSVDVSSGLLQSMGRTRNAVETILKIGQQLAELNPIAEVVVGLCTQALETLKKQDQCEAMVAKLVNEMGDVLSYVVAVEDHAKLAKLQGTIKELLELVEDASRFVIEYKSNGAAVRAARAFVSLSAQDQVDGFVDRFARLKESFDRGLVVQIGQRVQTLLSHEDRALIEKSIVPGAGYDLGRGCLEGTRLEILDDIREWALACTSSSLFWLYGTAGCGKSAISTSVSKLLHDTGVLGGNFFCKRDNESLRKPENVISHLAASLARRCPEYGEKLIELLREEPELAHSSLRTQFASLVAGPLQSLARETKMKTLVLVVDAIDECGTVDSRPELVRCLLEMSNLVYWLKILVTSRPNEEISILLETGREHIQRRDLFSENERNISRDIVAYIRNRMESIPIKMTGRTQWPDEFEIIGLAESSNKLFIWARTACNLIQQNLDPTAILEQILTGQPPESSKQALGEIYTTALNEALGEANDNARTVQLCVGAIVLTGSRRPLPDAALAALLSKHVKPHVLSRVISRLGSVLYRDDQTAVRVLHQSFSDYMAEEDCPRQYRINVAVQNASLAASCLEIMLQGLRFNICGLEDSCVMNHDFPDLPHRIERNIRPELLYSSVYWADHLVMEAFNAVSSETIGLLDRLLFKPRLLYWIEVLSLSKELQVIMERMNQLMRWIDNPEDRHTKAAADVYRFLNAAFEPISSSTPHLYVSALPFGAANYETLRALEASFPNALSVTKGMNLWNLPCLRTIDVGESVTSISLSANNQRIVSGCSDGTLRIWSAQTGAALLEPLRGHSGIVNSLAISLDCQRIVSGSDDQTVRIWDGQTGAALVEPLRGHTNRVRSVAISSDGRRIASGSEDRTVRIWDARTGVLLLGPLLGHSDSVYCVSISSDSRRIVSGSWDHTLRIWDGQTGFELLEPLRGHWSVVSCVVISSNDQCIVSGSWDKTVRIWNARTGVEMLEPLQGHRDIIHSVVMSLDGRRIVSSSGQEVRIWDSLTGASLLELNQDHSRGVTAVAISSDGGHIATGSWDEKVKIWDVQIAAALPKPLEGHSNSVTAVAISHDGQRIVSGSDDGTVRTWNTQTGTALLGPLRGHSSWVNCVSISCDGQFIVSGGLNDKTIRIWDAQTGTISKLLQGSSRGVAAITISSDSKSIVSGSSDGRLQIWDAQTGAALLEPLQGHSDWVTSVAIFSGGRQIVSGSKDKTIRLWDGQTGAALLDPLLGHSDWVNSVAISPDGRRIVSGSQDKTVRIWDAKTGEVLLEPLRGHSHWVHSVAISTTGQFIASGSGDSTVRIWDMHTGRLLVDPLRGHSLNVESVVITCDGRIVSGSRDKTIRIWDIAVGCSLLEPLPGPPESERYLDAPSSGQCTISSSSDKMVRVWDTSSTIEGEPLQGSFGGVNCVAISCDSRTIVSGSDDNSVRIWNTCTRLAHLEPLLGHLDAVISVAISSDGKRTVSGSKDNTVRIWDTHTGSAFLAPLEGHSGWVNSVALSSDGRFAVSASEDCTVRIWDTHTGDGLPKSLRGHSGTVNSVAISSDGQRVVSCSNDTTVRIWDAHTGDMLCEPLRGHSAAVTSVAISSDGQRVVSGSQDKTVRVWNGQTGTTLFGPLYSHKSSVSHVAISADGRQIISGSSNDMVRIWSAQAGVSLFLPIHIHSLGGESFAISSDGRRIVIGTNDAIYFWDCLACPSPLKDKLGFSRSIRDQDPYAQSVELYDVTDKQGWVHGSSGERLLWIPPEYIRRRFDQSLLAISTTPEDHPVAFDLSKVVVGTDWVKIVG